MKFIMENLLPAELFFRVKKKSLTVKELFVWQTMGHLDRTNTNVGEIRKERLNYGYINNILSFIDWAWKDYWNDVKRPV